jgi:hypothetical protein
MSTEIANGVGNSDKAKVDSDNRLHTLAVTRSELAYTSDKKQLGFMYSLGDLTLPASEAFVAYNLNNDVLHNVFLSRIIVSWNGGNTNHNRVAKLRFYSGNPAPTVNFEVVTPGNLYVGSTNTADMVLYGWDGGGAGMTIGAGMSVMSAYVAQGATVIELDGAMIFPKGRSMIVSVEAEEIGDFSYSAFYYTKPVGA